MAREPTSTMTTRSGITVSWPERERRDESNQVWNTLHTLTIGIALLAVLLAGSLAAFWAQRQTDMKDLRQKDVQITQLQNKVDDLQQQVNDLQRRG